ncbi:MAG: hypothetical protein ACKO96_16335 [Flammeovirgaceae bacterium]
MLYVKVVMLSIQFNFNRFGELLMVLILIVNGLIVAESIESNELNRETSEQTTEVLEEELAVCEKRLVVKKSVFVADSQASHCINNDFNPAYSFTTPNKNPRPILHRSLLL